MNLTSMKKINLINLVIHQWFLIQPHGLGVTVQTGTNHLGTTVLTGTNRLGATAQTGTSHLGLGATAQAGTIHLGPTTIVHWIIQAAINHGVAGSLLWILGVEIHPQLETAGDQTTLITTRLLKEILGIIKL